MENTKKYLKNKLRVLHKKGPNTERAFPPYWARISKSPWTPMRNTQDIGQRKRMYNSTSFPLACLEDSRRQEPIKATEANASDLDGDVPREASVQSLIEASAKVVGRTHTCRDLEESGFTLDTHLLIKIGYYAFPQDFTHPLTLDYLGHSGDVNSWLMAIRLIDDDQVKDVRQIGFMLIGHVSEPRRFLQTEAHVTLTFEKQQIMSCKCTACSSSSVCRHALAVMIFRIRFPHKLPIHAPVTETLSSLNKDQMLILIKRLISDRPEGTLNKIMKYRDRMQRENSGIHEATGAPDATFMMYSKPQSMWQLSLEKLSDDLKYDLIKRNPSIYHYFVNVHVPQSNNRFWRIYMTRVLDLLSLGNIEPAVQILITITECVTSVILDKKSVNKYLSSASRFLYDIERQLCFFVVCYNGRWRHEILTAAARANRLLSQCSWYMDREAKEPSEYNDIRNIKLSMKTLKCMEIAEDHEKFLSQFNPEGPMYQVLVCAFLPERLISDLNVDISSSCDMPLEVLLFVVDLLVQWKWVHVGHCRSERTSILESFGLRILEIVIPYSDQFSIMLHDETLRLNDGMQNTHIIDEDSEDLTADCEVVEGKIREKRGLEDTNGSSSPRKRMRFYKNQMNLSEGQIYCTLLFTSHLILTSSEESTTEREETRNVVKAFIRSVEMERFAVRAHYRCLTNFQYKLLHEITKRMIEVMKTSSNNDGINHLQSHTAEYGKAILRHGLDFYGGSIPLHLIDIIIREGTIDNVEKFEFCFLCLKSSTSLLRDTVNLGNSYSDSDHYGFRSMRVALMTCRTLLETLLNDHVYVSCMDFMPKILIAMDNVGKVKDLHFLMMAFDLYNDMMEGFDVSQEERVVDLITNLLREIAKVSFPDKYYQTHNKMFTALCTLAEKTFVHSFRGIVRSLEQVCRIFNSHQLKKLINLLEKGISNNDDLLVELTKELTSYLRRNVKHGIIIVDFIFILRNFQKGRHACIDEVLDHCGYFSADIILYLAKKEHEVGSKRVTRQHKLFSDRVFKLIKAGILNLTKKQTASRMLCNEHFETEFLIFFMDIFGENIDTALTKGEQFSEFLHLVTEKCELNTIAKLFTAQETSTETIRNQIGELLYYRISNIFLNCLTMCNHIHYCDIVIKILNTKIFIEKFVPNGRDRFYDMINLLKEKHKGKKKLQRMLNITFEENP